MKSKAGSEEPAGEVNDTKAGMFRQEKAAAVVGSQI
jgi:hypothetical protein